MILGIICALHPIEEEVMNWQDNKFEITVVAGLALSLFGLFSLFRPMSERRGFETNDITYEMARANSFTPAEYDLSGREIDREYVNPFEKVEAPTSKKTDKKSGAMAKKAQAKKAQNKKAQAQNKKKPGVDVHVVEDSKRTLSESGDDQTVAALAPETRNLQKTEPKKNEDSDEKNKDQRSPDQWKALLLAEPTYENMKKLILAFSNKEIEPVHFYKILQSLIENQNPQTQSVGLYGAQSFPTVESFTLIVKSEDILTGNAKKFSEQILLAYNQPQSVGVLGQVLRSSDEAVVLKAGEIIMAGIQKYKNGESVAEGNRTSRGDVKIKSATQYSVLIPTLQQLASHSNGTVVQLANSVLSQIQSLLASSPAPTPTAG